MKKRVCILLAVVILMTVSLPFVTLGADDIYPDLEFRGGFCTTNTVKK